MGSGVVNSLMELNKINQDTLIFQASMKEVAVNTIVVTEIACWFFIGECIGKGSLVGYNV